MRNLTTMTLLFAPDESAEGFRVPPSGPVAAECFDESLVLDGDRIRAGDGWVDAARVTPGTATGINTLNRLIERELAVDRTETGDEGLVLVPRRLLQYVDAPLRSHVAAPPTERHGTDGTDEPVLVTMLIRPPLGDTNGAGPSEERGMRAANGTRLQVIVAPDGDGWVAQGIELDYAAGGRDAVHVRKRFLAGLEATANLHLELYGDLSRLLQATATNVWTNLMNRKSRAEGRFAIRRESVDLRKAGLLFDTIYWIVCPEQDD